MGINTDLNVDPYFDDYDEDKKFHRVLFRPGKAVQARELTQLQTILQNQVDRFGQHVFKEGTVVLGCELALDLEYYYVQVRDRDGAGSNALLTMSSWANTTVTGGTTGITARVVNQVAGSEAAAPEYNTLYVKYTAAGTNNTSQVFTTGETLTSNSSLSANVVTSNTAAGIGSAITINDGVMFVKGHFVQVSKQTLLLDPFTNVPSYKVGYQIDEALTDSDADSSLLDNATGAFNFAAPGANRLKLTPTLVKKSLTTNDLDQFYQLYEIENGMVKVDGQRTAYADLRKEFARRTFDESGNYSVNPMNVRIREHLDDTTNQGIFLAAESGDINKLGVGIEPGKAFVHGFEYETLMTTWMAIDKGTDTIEVEAQPVAANYGNYVLLDEFSGDWDIDNLPTVSLRSAASDAISGNTYGATAAAGTEVGTAKARAVTYSSGTPNAAAAQYKLYLFDIKLTANSFSTVRSIHLDNPTGTDAVGDCVLESSVAVLKETGFNRCIWRLPQASIKRLRDSSDTIDNTFQFQKQFDVTVATDGTFTIATGAADEIYPFSTGVLNDTQKDANFIVTMDETAETSNLTGTAFVDSSSNTVNGLSTTFNTQFIVGDRIIVGGNGPYLINAITDANTLVITTQPGTIVANNFTKQIRVGEVLDMGESGTDGSRSITIGSTTSASYDIQETFDATKSATVLLNLQQTDGQETQKTFKASRLVEMSTSAHYANTVGPWGLGVSDVYSIQTVRKHSSAFTANTDGTDVTTHFELDDGQRDNHYEHGRLKQKASSSLTISSGDHIQVKFNHFTHDVSGGHGYLSVDSYPIDDANTANTSAITTQQIPIYTSPTTGEQYNLRDSLDIRPIRTNTANDVTTLTNISVNPANSTAFTVPAGGQHFVGPNETMTFDLSYYLGRKDKVVIDIDGQFKTLKGISSLFPRTPEDTETGMTLAVVNIPPFPSLSPYVAGAINRQDLSATVKQQDNQRFTMRDISVLEQRVNSLEYYTSLSLLEKDTAETMILDATGNNRFKNGIMVDPFTGHGVGDITERDYKIAVDEEKQEIRPTFDLMNVDLTIDASNSTNIYRNANDAILTVSGGTGTMTRGENVYQGASLAGASARGFLTHDVGTKLYVENSIGTWATSTTVTGDDSGGTYTVDTIALPTAGDLGTLPYEHSIVAHQPFATKGRNPSSELSFLWQGSIQLDPDTDTWTDSIRRPDVQVNFDGNADAWERLGNAWGTQWGDWKTNWTGKSTSSETADVGISRIKFGDSGVGDIFNRTETTKTTTTTQRQSRTGIQLNVKPGTQSRNIGAKVVDVTVIPFMRAKQIQVTAKGLKPNTRVYAFFDGENVSGFCAEVSSFTIANLRKPAYGTAMTTDSTGKLTAVFLIPNTSRFRFRVGTKTFKLTNSSTNSDTDVSTSAETNYSATGLQQSTEDTIISTRTAEVAVNSITGNRKTQDVSTLTTSGERFVGHTPNPTVTYVTEVTEVVHIPTPVPESIDTSMGGFVEGSQFNRPLPPGHGGFNIPEGCFAGNTLIMMADKTRKFIQDIRIGDLVAAFDFNNPSTLFASKVLETMKHVEDSNLNNRCIILETSSDIKISTTTNHPFAWWHPEHGYVWKRIDRACDSLMIDEWYLVTENNEFHKVVAVTTVPDYVHYNFEVETYHSYIAEGYAVHNQKDPDGYGGPSDPDVDGEDGDGFGAW